MSDSRLALPVVIPPGTGQNFSCHSCTRCCRELVVELFEADRARIDEHRMGQNLSVAPYIRRHGKWVLNKHADGRCVFLLDDGKCRIHAEVGFEAKPLACRMYPFLLVPTADRILTSWRFDCPSVVSSKGQPIREHADLVSDLAAEALKDRTWRSPPVHLQPGLPAEPSELDALDRAVDHLLTQPRLTLIQRIQGVVWLTENLAKAKLTSVRRDRFQTLVELLAGSWEEELKDLSSPTATAKHFSLFRQWAFAHSGFVAFSEMEQSLVGRLKLRWRQLAAAERYRKGTGAIPANPTIGIPQPIAFEALEQIESPADGQAIEEVILRYLRTRILSRTAYGPAYYRWAATRGLAALCLDVAVLGWWSRCFAAASARTQMTDDDVFRALALIDGAAGRIPALGSISERLRIDHLLGAGVIGDLIRRYFPVSVK